MSSTEGAVLIDAGISYKSLKNGLESIGNSLADLRGIFVTHAHWDHIRGLPVLMKHLNVPIIAAESTLHFLGENGKVDRAWERIFDLGQPLISKTIGELGPFKYTTIRTMHDIDGACSFKIQHVQSGINVSVVTDTGSLTEFSVGQLAKSDAVLLESNYDRDMLKESTRPQWLKERIRKYHLSNASTSLILQDLRKSDSKRLKALFLGHLSGECNSIDAVTEWVGRWSRFNDPEWQWFLSPRESASDLIEINHDSISVKKRIAGEIVW